MFFIIHTLIQSYILKVQSQRRFHSVNLYATETMKRDRQRWREREKWSEKCIDCHIRFGWITSQAHHEWGIELFDPIAPDPHISFIIRPWWKQFRVHCFNMAESLSAYWLSQCCAVDPQLVSLCSTLKSFFLRFLFSHLLKSEFAHLIKCTVNDYAVHLHVASIKNRLDHFFSLSKSF